MPVQTHVTVRMAAQHRTPVGRWPSAAGAQPSSYLPPRHVTFEQELAALVPGVADDHQPPLASAPGAEPQWRFVAERRYAAISLRTRAVRSSIANGLVSTSLPSPRLLFSRAAFSA